MAGLPASPLVSVDEYLNTSYEHDVEFVNGALVERGMPTPVHSILQGCVYHHLWQFCRECAYGVPGGMPG